MKKTKLLLPALTLSMLGTAICGGCLVAAAAEPQARDGGPTVGEFVSWDGYTFQGTSANAADNKTVITTLGTSGWYRSLVPVQGVTSDMTVEVSLTADAATPLQITLFDYPDAASQFGSTTATLEANVEYTTSIALTTAPANIYIAFYMDIGNDAGTVSHVTVNSLTVGGVSYKPTTYIAPVTAPDKSFKENTDWTVTNGTVAANTLEKLEGDAAEGTIDNGSAIVNITDPTKLAMTSDDDHKITTLVEIPLSETLAGWPSDWTNFYLKLKVNNVSEVYGYFQSVDNCSECLESAEWKGWHAFAFNLWSGAGKSVTDGYRIANAIIGGYIKSYMDTHAAAPTKIVLGFLAKDGATEASVEIGGMTFGGKDAPKFINDIGTPKLEIGEWANQDSSFTINEKGSLKVEDVTYSGLQLTYKAENVGGGANATAVVSNFDSSKTPILHLGFYTDHDITMAIYADWGTDLGGGHATYTAGYHALDLSVSGITTSSFYLRLFIDNSAGAFEGTKNIVVNDITFYKDDVSIALDEATTNGLFDTPKVTDGKLSWSWDAKNAGAYYAVSVPVDGWYPYNRSILHVNVTLSHDAAFGIWGNENAFLDDTLKISTHPVLKAGTYDMYLNTSSTSFVKGGLNNVMFYCDVQNASEASLTKTVTINEIEFVKTAPLTSSPNANGLTVNYLEQKVTFADTLEVATDKDFTAKLTSGATVTPGATLYLRAADGSSAVTVVTLSSTTLTKDTAPEATVGENFIRFGASGYEYKMVDKDSDWVTLGSWGNLKADTEYTILVRVKATDTSFVSETVELKIKTSKATSTPDTPDPGEDKKPEEEKKKGCSGVIGLGSAGLAALTAIAVGAVAIVRKKKD